MRNRLLTMLAALLLSSHLGMAQTSTQQTPTPVPSPPPAPTFPTLGTIDLGGIFGDVDGDEARYERYRDTRNGLYSNINFSKETGTYLFEGTASHIGYRDQRYTADYYGSKVKFSFLYDWTPTNFSYVARTPWVTNGNVLTLDDGAQTQVQGRTNSTTDGTAVGVPCAPGAPPAACGNPTLANQAKAARSVYNTLADTFDMRQERKTAAFAVAFAATPTLDVDAKFVTTGKDGEMPWGASYAFNNANEIPLPLENRTNDFSLGASWAGAKAMFRVGWDGSWFNNDIQSIRWDNPIRITDFNNGQPLYIVCPEGTPPPPSGPWDCSGYINGNGPAFGTMTTAPSNSMNVFSATGFYRMPGRTTVNGTLQFTSQTQDESLIPWTSNPVIATAATYTAFPHLATLPRATADAGAKGTNVLFNLNSRPLRFIGFQARYRYNERDVNTPQFDATEYVRFDAVPEEIEEGFSHQYDTTRQTFDANALFSLTGWGGLRVGYGHDAYERHGRGFDESGEDTFRVSFDTVWNRVFSIRASFDVSSREGEGFVETGTDYEEGPGGTQPTLRYYDEGDRDRRRASILLNVNPGDVVNFYVSYAGGRDEYGVGAGAPVSRPDELFGLQEAEVTAWTLGFNVYPREGVTLGANYGREEFSSTQKSRNANPAPDPSWDDPARDWFLDNDEDVDNFNLYLDLSAFKDVEIRAGYDYSESDNGFNHYGPRINALRALSPPQSIPLPNVTNTWQRLTADLKYFFTARAGLGVGYYFEKLDIEDFNTIDEGGPVGFGGGDEVARIDWLGGLITGYGNRPYSGSNVYLRFLYRF